MWELRNILLGNLLSLYLYSPLKTALFPHFSYKVLGVLPRLVWSCNASLFSQLWEYLRASRKWEPISLGLSESVGIKELRVMPWLKPWLKHRRVWLVRSCT